MMHPWVFLNSRCDNNGKLLGCCEFAVGPQWFTLEVLLIRDGTPMVHPWAIEKSRWDPNGAPLGFCEFAVEPKGCSLGIPLGFREFAVGPQW